MIDLTAQPPETYSDQPLRFAIPAAHARGRAVRLTGVLDTILAAHAYPPVAERLLAEAITLAALLGLLLKDEDGQLTIQAQTDAGAVDLLVCDYRRGEVRGYVKFDPDRLAEAGDDPSLFALFGQGYLAVTFDQPGLVPKGGGAGAGAGRYQGIVPLEGESLSSATAYYFVQSEQVPTLIRTAFRRDAAGPVAGGLLLQHLPEGEEGRERLHVRLDHPEWETARILGESLTDAELTDRALSLEAIVWRLFHEEPEIRVTREAALVRGCRCSAAHIRDVIGRFAAPERAEMADDAGVISVDCEFCARSFPLTLASFDN